MTTPLVKTIAPAARCRPLLAAAGAIAIAGGCAHEGARGGRGGADSLPFAQRPAPVAAQQVAQPAAPPALPPQESPAVRFADGSSPPAAVESSPPQRERSPASIGIYGEPLAQFNGDASVGDGAGNLAQITFGEEGENFDPDLDPTGEWIAFASTQHRSTADIYLKPISGSTLTQLTNDPADDITPEFSPDGQWIAFASDRGGSFDIYVMPTSGGQARLIAGDSSHELHPTWSPNGRQIAYCKFGEQSRRWELWVVDVENSATRSFIDYGFLPEWSPDPARNALLFQRARERGSRYHSIWTIDLVDGQGRHATEIVSASNAAVINPSWSPDGRQIVFATVVRPEESPGEKPTASDLWVVRIDGSGRTSLTSGEEANFQPTWGADGRIYFISSRSGADNIWAVEATTSDVKGDSAVAHVEE